MGLEEPREGWFMSGEVDAWVDASEDPGGVEGGWDCDTPSGVEGLSDWRGNAERGDSGS